MKITEAKKIYNQKATRLQTALGYFDMNPESIENEKVTNAFDELSAEVEVWGKTIETAIGRELTNNEVLNGFQV